MKRGGGEAGTRGSGQRVQGFDGGLSGRDSVILALVDQTGNHRFREIPYQELEAGSAIEFLRDAWTDGFGGGQPETLEVDRGVSRYDREMMVFLRDRGVRVALVQGPARGMRGKRERVLKELRAGAPLEERHGEGATP